MTAIMMVIPKELVYLVIELLDSDPVWWLEEEGERERERGGLEFPKCS